MHVWYIPSFIHRVLYLFRRTLGPVGIGEEYLSPGEFLNDAIIISIRLNIIPRIIDVIASTSLLKGLLYYYEHIAYWL